MLCCPTTALTLVENPMHPCCLIHSTKTGMWGWPTHLACVHLLYSFGQGRTPVFKGLHPWAGGLPSSDQATRSASPSMQWGVGVFLTSTSYRWGRDGTAELPHRAGSRGCGGDMCWGHTKLCSCLATRFGEQNWWGLFPWWHAEIIATEGAPCLELILPPPPWERLKNMARPLQPRLHNPKSFVLCLSDLVRRKR